LELVIVNYLVASIQLQPKNEFFVYVPYFKRCSFFIELICQIFYVKLHNIMLFYGKYHELNKLLPRLKNYYNVYNVFILVILKEKKKKDRCLLIVCF
jgi:hypothetical protein